MLGLTVDCNVHITVKAHASGRNFVGQQHATLLGTTCCISLHRTTTMWAMLAPVAYSLKTIKLLGPCKRRQHCWPKTPNNTQQCCDLLRPFAWAFTTPMSRTFNVSSRPVCFSCSSPSLIELHFGCCSKTVLFWWEALPKISYNCSRI